VRGILIILGALVFFPLGIFAQLVNHIDSIPVVEVDYVQSLKSSTSFDTLISTSSLKSIGDLLMENSNVQIKQSGGKGSTQSLNIRGFSSSQNQVNWNGLPINSLTLGMFDLAGSSVGAFDKLELINGSSSVEYGGGAIGGVLDLKNTPSWNKGLNLSIGGSLGSFNANMNRYQFSYSNKKFSYSLLFIDEFVKNNYDFINKEILGKPQETQEHAQFWNSNLVQEVYYRKGKNKFKLVTWLSGRKKNTPKFLTATQASRKSTADSSFRNVINYTRIIKSSLLDVSYGYSGSGFNYWDYNDSIFTDYSVSEHFLLAGFKFKYKKFKFRIKSRVERQTVINSRYEGTPQRVQNFNTSFVNYKIKENLEILAVLGTQTSTSTSALIPIGTFGYKYVFAKKKATLKGNIANHYRYPTFNDLFWDTGGNLELKPEEGCNIEQSFNLKTKHHSFQSEIYYSNVRNWILWMPNGSLWSPQNVKGVTSYGSNVNYRFNFKINKVKLSLNSGITYTKTTVTESTIENDPAIGNQATYVPLVNGNVSLAVIWKRFVLKYQTAYKDKQYTSADNNERSALPSYFMNNISASRLTKIKSYSFLIKGEVQNLFDAEYSVDRSYVMPGRAFYLSIILNFNLHTPKKENNSI
jgi:iron complex outermembrane receptor protein